MWFKELLSASNDASHKRFISLVAIAVCVATHVESACGIVVDYQIMYMFAGMTLMQSGLTVYEKTKTQ